MYVDQRFKITSYSMSGPSNKVTWLCKHIVDKEEPNRDGIYRIHMSRKEIDLMLSCESRITGIGDSIGSLMYKPCVNIYVPYKKINSMMASGLTYGITGKCDLMKVGMTDNGLRFIHHDSKNRVTVQNTSNRAFRNVVLECAKVTKNSSARERIGLQNAELEFVSEGGEITKNTTDF